MKILIAPDSFKGSMTAETVCRITKKAAQDIFPAADIQMLPLADGGEGTCNALMEALHAEAITCKVQGPLGDSVAAQYGLLETGPVKIAIMDMASASGLTLVPEAKRDVFRSSTFGTGEMMLDAIERGCRHIYLGLGGSATSDGGMGMAAALGVRFLDETGNRLDPVPVSMEALHWVDVSALDSRIAETRITVMSDVKNPLLGPSGAVYVYGPQKGIPESQLRAMDSAMEHYIDIVEKATRKKIRTVPGAGAAGGLGAGLLAFTSCEIQSGIETVLALLKFDELLADTDIVITGEGRMDAQSAFGKVIAGVAAHCKSQNIPCLALAGSLGEGAEDMYELGVTGIMPLVDRITSLDEAISHSEENCYRAAVRMLRILCSGFRQPSE